jgi:hypothetical protein
MSVEVLDDVVGLGLPAPQRLSVPPIQTSGIAESSYL